MQAQVTSSMTSIFKLLVWALAFGLVIVGAGPGVADDKEATGALEILKDKQDKFDARGKVQLKESIRIPVKNFDTWTEKGNHDVSKLVLFLDEKPLTGLAPPYFYRDSNGIGWLHSCSSGTLTMTNHGKPL